MTHYNFGNVQKCFSKKQRNVNLKKGNSHKKGPLCFKGGLSVTNTFFWYFTTRNQTNNGCQLTQVFCNALKKG